MKIERRKLIIFAAAGLISTSWGIDLRSEWVPENNPQNSYLGGYGSVSTHTETPPYSEDKSLNTTSISVMEILDGAETDSGTDTATEAEGSIDIELQTETTPEAESSTDAETQTQTDPSDDINSVSPPSTGSNNAEEEVTPTPEPELPDSGYGIDAYGHPIE
ncbi:hypothetical protein OB955_19410 [Halobacteria archaeon AArc-m2/3/4]|uniref:SipW-cognate class signal peptide n=1 Tax=Natronoglomus mannanivorans TaxID=2979990 RepID=A0ABT2QIW9_9EURY|nr:hypothetical protein [Halobacteria archaeon AArc-m2/3/4]